LTDKVKLISSIPLFSSLPRNEIENLAGTLHTRHYPAGEILLEEGATDTNCFIVQEGRVEIIKSLGTPDERILAVREYGTILGEMSLFTPNKAHTASVRALTPLTLLEITRSKFDTLLHRQPGIAYEIARVTSEYLDESENLTILDLRKKNLELNRAYEELKAAQEQIIEKELLEKELQIARTIQQSILPQVIPQFEALQCGALMVPARSIGGDFYDFIPLGDDLLGVVVGDVSDKGVPAALCMALTYSLVRAEASHTMTPGETLRRVNRHLLDINASDMFVTLLYGVINIRSGVFNYARAGQLPPVLAAAGCREVPVPYRLGQALGLFEDPVLDEQQIELPPEGQLLLFSDGLTDAMNQKGDYFGSNKLLRFLAESEGTSAQDVCQMLWQAVQEYAQGVSQTDDFTVAALQRKAVKPQ
jgi:sigma-B regulation protein RsbU (phosphoserine phosphatase)